MSHILHLGHQPADLSGVEAADLSTASGRFDPALDNNGLEYTVNLEIGPSFGLPIAEPVSDEVWLQLRTVFAQNINGGLSSTNKYFLQVRDIGGVVLCGIEASASGSGYRLRAWANDASPNYGAYAPWSAGNAYWIDVKVEIVGSDITLSLYMNEVLVSTATGSRPGGSGKPRGFLFEWWPMRRTTTTSTTSYIAHFAVLDGVSTLGRRFARLRPAAAGEYEQWTGDPANLGGGGIMNAIIATAPGQRTSFTLAGPTLPAHTAIAGLHLAGRASGGSSVPQIAPFVRIDSVDYDGDLEPISTDVSFYCLTLEENPETDSPWTEATLPDEVGFLSGS